VKRGLEKGGSRYWEKKRGWKVETRGGRPEGRLGNPSRHVRPADLRKKKIIRRGTEKWRNGRGGRTPAERTGPSKKNFPVLGGKLQKIDETSARQGNPRRNEPLPRQADNWETVSPLNLKKGGTRKITRITNARREERASPLEKVGNIDFKGPRIFGKGAEALDPLVL